MLVRNGYPPGIMRGVRALLLTLGTVVVFVSGCVPGPDFVPPEAEVAPEWSEGVKGRVSLEGESEAGWWKLFKDPVLDRLVAKAGKQNLTVQLAGLRVMEALAQYGIAWGNQWPQGQQATADLAYNRNPAYLPDPEFTSAGVGVDASWELNLWGKYRRGIESANAALLAMAVTASKRALALSQIHYKEGESQFQRVLDSTRTLLQQQDQYTQAVASISNNVVALYKALGGGWTIEEMPEYVPVGVRRQMKNRTKWGNLLRKPANSADGQPAGEEPEAIPEQRRSNSRKR